MSETPENKKARLRLHNVFQTAWTDEFHFIKHSRKGNKFAFCEFCRTDFSINNRGHSDVTKHVGTANPFVHGFINIIFKVLTTQILYPKCSLMHHLHPSEKKDPPPLPLLVSRGMGCMVLKYL